LTAPAPASAPPGSAAEAAKAAGRKEGEGESGPAAKEARSGAAAAAAAAGEYFPVSSTAEDVRDAVVDGSGLGLLSGSGSEKLVPSARLELVCSACALRG
ncbi:unnamed protein product, partial [Pylaiella littoralis]